MKFNVVVCKYRNGKLYKSSIICLELESIDLSEQVISHLMMKQTERLVGLFDNGLLGTAYRAFNWTNDEEYNNERRLLISNHFMSSYRNGTFYKSRNTVYVIPHKHQEWIDIAHSIASRPDGESYKLSAQEEYIATAHLLNEKIVDEQVLSGLRSWFQKAKERQ